MARSHHRKKHKEHVRQFRQEHGTATSSSVSKGKTGIIFTLLGAALGAAISYFAIGNNLFWIVAGLIAGTVIGYYIGRGIDKA